MSQQPLFVPASDGWYARPGDPPGIARHWDGKTWQCEFRGPMKDHFNHLRSMPAEMRSDADRDLLKKLTNDVSDIEDLVMGDPSANPPLVQIAAPPPYIPPPVATYGTGPSPKAPSYGAPPPVVPVYLGQQPTPALGQPMGQPMQPMPQAPMAYIGPPPTQPYMPQPPTEPYMSQQQQQPVFPPMLQGHAPAHGQPGPSATPGGTPRFSAPRKKGFRWLRVGLIVGLVAVVGVVGRFGATALANTTLFSSTSAALAVSSCVTLSYPSGATDEESVSWAKSECTTTSDGPVSYIIVSKLAGAAQCDPDSQYVQTFSTGTTVAYTYCLMENLTVGQCVYEDGKGFLFDVPCSDTRALVKISQRVDKGSGVECAVGEGSWRFPAGNRTYCLSKP
ncbi:MAG: hypothetical protein ACOH16_00140 [Propionibacteriaceae bacterium]